MPVNNGAQNYFKTAHERQAYGINAVFPATAWVLTPTGRYNSDIESSRAELALQEHRGRDCRYRNMDAAAGQQEEPHTMCWNHCSLLTQAHREASPAPRGWLLFLADRPQSTCKVDLVHAVHSSNPGQLWVANNKGGEKRWESISHLSDEGTSGDKSTIRDPLGMLSNALIPSLLKSGFPPLKFSTAN